MKKYKFSKASHIFDWSIVIVFTLALLAFVFFVMKPDNLNSFYIIVVIVVTLPVVIKHTKRGITVYDNCIEFFSYHIDKKYQNAKLCYENITKISKCWCFDISMWGIKIETATYASPIKIEGSVENNIELFNLIVNKAKEANPNALISPDLLGFLESKVQNTN